MRSILLLLLLSGLGCAAAENDPGAWVAAQEGTVTRDGAGHITGVSLRGSWITDTDLAVLARLPNLRKIDLSETHITDLGLEQLKPLDNITDLNLYFCEHVTDGGVAHLKGWKKLQRLNLRGTKITDTSLEHLSTMTSLVALDVGFAMITNDGLAQLSGLSNLRELMIGGNKLSDSGMQFLKSLPGLTKLDLGGAQRTDSGLWSVTITDEGLDAVATLAHLRELNLDGTKISDLGLAKLKGLAELRSLNLGRTQISTQGLKNLTGLKNLETLILYKDKKIDDSAVPVLKSMPQLQFVDLAETGITSKLSADLRRTTR